MIVHRPKKFLLRALPIILPLTVFLVVLALGQSMNREIEARARQQQRYQFETMAENQAKGLERYVLRSLGATYALSAVVREHGGLPEQETFDSLSKELLKSFPGLSNLQLAPGGVVTLIYPLEGNEKVIGHDLLSDPLRDKEAHQAVATGNLTLAGPFTTIQGTTAIIGRNPVYLPSPSGEDQFWGFATAFMNLSHLLEDSGLLHQLEPHFSYELWRLHPDTGQKQVFAESTAIPANPISVDILVPNGHWTLSLAPIGGWGQAVENRVATAINAAAALLCAAFVFALLHQPRKLQRIVEERTRDLEEINDELMAEIHERELAEAALKSARQDLERRVVERTAKLSAANEALTDALAATDTAVQQLIESEKLAALGGLVAGVAHEINTPVGVGVTAVSYLEEMTRKIQKDLENNTLKKSALERYLQVASEATVSIHTNLRRASSMIQSFKQVAVDQSSEGRRRFNLGAYLDEILLSLRPQLKKTPHQIRIDCPDDLEIDSFPGAISQIVSNLLFNSITHGFDNERPGQIELRVQRLNAMVELRYSDNGCGMDKEMLAKIFDPFFTTRRGQGGSGLGMHIVYNLVTRTLGGKIFCTSLPGQGTSFDIVLPESAPEPFDAPRETSHVLTS